MILMGSGSDWEEMAPCESALRDLGIGCEVRVASAQRSPRLAGALVESAAGEGFQVIVCGAGGSAHLAGMAAALTPLPVIGVPLGRSPLGGFDALLSTVQMPPGVPVATMGVGKMGAENAAVLCARILALSDAEVARSLERQRSALAKKVVEADTKLQKERSLRGAGK
jgi:phosphoribosylaminoimidazole carboxylase PurE protein